MDLDSPSLSRVLSGKFSHDSISRRILPFRPEVQCINGRGADWCRRRPGDHLDVGFFRHLQSIVDLDPEISNRALNLRVPEQQLNRSEIFGAVVDQ